MTATHPVVAVIAAAAAAAGPGVAGMLHGPATARALRMLGVPGAPLASTVALAPLGAHSVMPATAAATALCAVAVPVGAVTLAGASVNLAVSVPSATSEVGALPLVTSLEHLLSLWLYTL